MTSFVSSTALTGSRIRPRGRPAQNTVDVVDEDALLALAFAAFAERGYEGTTIRDLARRLGVSHNLINVRFGRKDELWRRAVGWRFDQASPFVTAAFEEPADAEARLRDVVHRFCLWAAENPDIVGLSHLEGNRAGWRLDFIVDRFVLPFKARLDGLVEAVGATRPVASLSTAMLMALLVQGVGYFFCAVPMQQRLGAGADADLAQSGKAAAAAMAEALLGGLLPAAATKAPA